MAVAIRLPDMGTAVEQCKLLAWRVEEGARVKRGDVLAEIETDKAVAELESAAEGVLLRKTVRAGDHARPGEVLAYVGEPGETWPGLTANEQPDIAPGHLRPEPAPLAPPASGAPLRVSPVVRNLAAKLGIELGTLRGTGAGGIITREDVLAASRAAPVNAEPLSRSQLAAARALLKSWREVPQFSMSITLDMTAAQRIRAQSEAEGQRPSYDAIFLKAMAGAIAAVPLMAAKLEGERVVRPQGTHIALAVAFENELFLPVIRDVERKDLRCLSSEIAALSSQIRSGRLKTEQMAGGCMALSNLGMYPIEAFEGIIFPGHSAILTLGTIQKKPVVVDERVEIRPLATAKLAADHRLINGRTAAEFLSKLKVIIESGNLT